MHSTYSGELAALDAVMTKPRTTKPTRIERLLATLSERELQVFTRLAAGDTMVAIGKALELSHTAVKTYRSRVLEKLGLETTRDVVIVAYKAGLTKAPEVKE